MNEFWRMSADLTFVLALVTAVNTLDTQTPIIRVLKLDGISRIARVRMLAHRQQTHLLATLLSSQPGDLREYKQFLQSNFSKKKKKKKRGREIALLGDLFLRLTRCLTYFYEFLFILKCY